MYLEQSAHKLPAVGSSQASGGGANGAVRLANNGV